MNNMKDNDVLDNVFCLTIINDTFVIGNGTNKGLFYSEDKGKTWNQSNITSGYYVYLATNNDTIILRRSPKTLLHSKDNGKTWDISKSVP